ncbi:hypothetical protein AURDEDRAFT_165822 [Auricularia subglabra TFB-10046 SS5]|nr:hypothetical protein AURDEDRAFT_165822 [Auricularia subglabra TFB-10046 SS5]
MGIGDKIKACALRRALNLLSGLPSYGHLKYRAPALPALSLPTLQHCSWGGLPACLVIRATRSPTSEPSTPMRTSSRTDSATPAIEPNPPNPSSLQHLSVRHRILHPLRHRRPRDDVEGRPHRIQVRETRPGWSSRRARAVCNPVPNAFANAGMPFVGVPWLSSPAARVGWTPARRVSRDPAAPHPIPPTRLVPVDAEVHHRADGGVFSRPWLTDLPPKGSGAVRMVPSHASHSLSLTHLSRVLFVDISTAASPRQPRSAPSGAGREASSAQPNRLPAASVSIINRPVLDRGLVRVLPQVLALGNEGQRSKLQRALNSFNSLVSYRHLKYPVPVVPTFAPLLLAHTQILARGAVAHAHIIATEIPILRLSIPRTTHLERSLYLRLLPQLEARLQRQHGLVPCAKDVQDRGFERRGCPVTPSNKLPFRSFLAFAASSMRVCIPPSPSPARAWPRSRHPLLAYYSEHATAWGLRVAPCLFLRDIHLALFPSPPPLRFLHYSPALQNAVLADASAAALDPELCEMLGRCSRDLAEEDTTSHATGGPRASRSSSSWLRAGLSAELGIEARDVVADEQAQWDREWRSWGLFVQLGATASARHANGAQLDHLLLHRPVYAGSTARDESRKFVDDACTVQIAFVGGVAALLRAEGLHAGANMTGLSQCHFFIPHGRQGGSSLSPAQRAPQLRRSFTGASTRIEGATDPAPSRDAVGIPMVSRQPNGVSALEPAAPFACLIIVHLLTSFAINTAQRFHAERRPPAEVNVPFVVRPHVAAWRRKRGTCKRAHHVRLPAARLGTADYAGIVSPFMPRPSRTCRARSSSAASASAQQQRGVSERAAIMGISFALSALRR